MKFKLIMENWRQFKDLQEQGVDQDGNPVTIGAAREMGDEKPGSAKEAGLQVLAGAGLDCSDNGSFEFLDHYGVFRELVIEPFMDSKAANRGDGSTTGPVDMFLATVELGFSACATDDEMQPERTGTDYHGYSPLNSIEQRNQPGWPEEMLRGASKILDYFKQQHTFHGVGRAFMLAIKMAEKNGHSPFMDKEGSVYRGAVGG